MNRALRASTLVLFLAAAAHPAFAGRSQTLELGVDYAKTFTDWSGHDLPGGPGVGVAMWHAVSPDLSVGIDASFDELGEVEYEFLDYPSYGRVEVDASVLRVSPSFRARIGGPDGPAFLTQFGAGLYHVSWHRLVHEGLFIFEDERQDNDVGISFGIGAALPLGSTRRVLVLGSYHVVAGENALAENFNHLQARAAVGLDF